MMESKITPKEKRISKIIIELLEEYFPDPPIPLNYTSSYTFLIAVLLSAQCTDLRVNKVTPHLFARASTPQEMVLLNIEEIAEIIRPCGLWQRKSTYIHALSQVLIDRYGGEVPSELRLLEELPGVGNKTASVVVSQMFKIPAFPIDTHIHRLAQRWKLSSGKNAVQTQLDLCRIFPRNKWNKLHLQLIYYARAFCRARGHVEEDCPICKALKNFF